jgi:hypothetical protein
VSEVCGKDKPLFLSRCIRDRTTTIGVISQRMSMAWQVRMMIYDSSEQRSSLSLHPFQLASPSFTSRSTKNTSFMRNRHFSAIYVTPLTLSSPSNVTATSLLSLPLLFHSPLVLTRPVFLTTRIINSRLTTSEVCSTIVKPPFHLHVYCFLLWESIS